LNSYDFINISSKGHGKRFHLTSEFNEVAGGDLGKMRAEHFSVKFLLAEGEEQSDESAASPSDQREESATWSRISKKSEEVKFWRRYIYKRNTNYYYIMVTASILYDIQHFELADIVDRKVKKINEETEINIAMKIVDGYQLMDKLKSNPNYNFVILHMGQNGEGAYRQADKCRRLTNAILVAESVMYPHGQSEVLQHFDDYMGLISRGDSLSKLLRKYAFISY